ncbi:MAG: MFS transporter [Gemmataceae bacterium]|nr:MFS transporter [Gemmataceae bacterium]
MSPPSSPGYRIWVVCGLLLLATMINYMDRMALNLTSKRIMEEFHFEEDFYGKLEGHFGLAFAVGAISTGLVADRLPIKLLYPFMVFFWSLSGFLTGLVQNKEELLACRIALGFFEAANWPCALVTTRRLLDPARRTMGNSILQSGAALGAILTPMIVQICLHKQTEESLPFIAGWRGAFLLTGMTGLVWIFLWGLFTWGINLKDQEPHDPLAKKEHLGTILGQIVWQKRFWILVLSVVSINLTWHFLRAWLPLYLQKARGYSESEVNYFFMGYYLAADIGSLSAGFLTLYLAKIGFPVFSSRLTTFGLFASLSLLSVLAAFIPTGPVFLGTLILMGFGTLGLFPCYYSFSQEISGRHQGKITGLLGSINWIGMYIMQTGAGYFIQGTKTHYLELFKTQGYEQGIAMQMAQEQAYVWGIAMAGIPPAIAFFTLLYFWKNPGEVRGKDTLS